MTILHLTDFHYNKRWFEWLANHAPAHDLAVLSGDLLDFGDPTPHRKQIAWVTDWLSEYPRPLCVSSGNHDLEWNDQTERWMPALWLRDITNENLATDGQRMEIDGLSVLNIGCNRRPKGGEADIWVVHAPPSRTLVAARAKGGDGGDPDLVGPVQRYQPQLVLSGHVHTPLQWHDRRERTLFLNPGRNVDAAFPNHILVETESMTCELVSAAAESALAPIEAPRPAAVAEAAAVSTAAA